MGKEVVGTLWFFFSAVATGLFVGYLLVVGALTVVMRIGGESAPHLIHLH